MDQTRRELERKAAAGGPNARRRLLLERVRAGEVTADGIELAAALGHEDARATLEVLDPEASQRSRAAFRDHELREWVWDLLPWGHRAVILAVVAGCRAHEREPQVLAKEAFALATALDQGSESSLESLAWATYRAAAAAHLSTSGESDKRVLWEVALSLRRLQAWIQDDDLRESVREALVGWALGG